MTQPFSRDEQRVLLRRFEPVLRYTRGEEYFPMRVGPYLANCSLWRQRAGQEAELLVPEGELTLEKLAEPRLAPFDTVHYLKFITPLNLTELASYRLQRLQEGLARRDAKEIFRAGPGRLARVGYGSRFVDALFQLSLLARGRVPGDTAAAAALSYGHIMAHEPHFAYYGRALRQNGWIALQYWFFYPFNNWRSGFFGANDHEADWEMICVYCSERRSNGEVHPEWVAYASHDFAGDDLRRHWNDPELEKVGEHPVVYAGAGSHASYYTAGEYLAELELPFLMPLVVLSDRLEQVWSRFVQRYSYQDETKTDETRTHFNIFRVPFVDYARGDGIAIGPGQKHEWDEPELLSPVPGWALHYRGLWGLYTRDAFSGEDAPAGPVYTRQGAVRAAWYDPVGWCGLDKVPPPDQALSYVLAQRTEVDARRVEVAEEIEQTSKELAGMGVRARAMQNRPHLEATFAEHQQELNALGHKLDRLKAEFAADEAVLEALDLYADRLRGGSRGPLRAHIRRAQRPASQLSLRFGRFAEVWAAVSISVMLITFVILFLVAPQYLGIGLLMLISVFIFVEAGFRRQLPRLVNSLSIGLATVASLVLFYEFFWPIVVVGVVGAGAYLMWENLRELWS